jgi:hypothetical protein
MPFLECSLSSESAQIRVSALVDCGATLNIMPYNIREQLGWVWSEQRLPLRQENERLRKLLRQAGIDQNQA